jgi:uncharacterized protein YceH (UPF0502 family)
MSQLTTIEARVLGVLIEKSLTTPDLYPLTLNATTSGCNQKNNRDPVLSLTEDEVFAALESLREKQLVTRVDQHGARVPKFKHNAIENLHIRTREAAILAELLIRGPQTLGELRSRASRMTPFERLEDVGDMLRGLIDRPQPLAVELGREPGSRAEKFAQTLCKEVNIVAAKVSTSLATEDSAAVAAVASTDLLDRIVSLEERVRALEAKLNQRSASEDSSAS